MSQDSLEPRDGSPTDNGSDARSSQVAFDCVIIVDEEDRIIDVNSAAEKALGYSREHVVGSRMVDVFSPTAFPEGIASGSRENLQTGGSDVLGPCVERTATRTDGSRFPSQFAVFRLSPLGQPRLVGLLRDYSEAKCRIAAQEAIYQILQLVIQPISLPELFEQVLQILVSVPWLKLQSKGAIFLCTEDEAQRMLVMSTQHGLSETHCSACSRVVFGRCLCGRAAAMREIVFAATVDEEHEIRYEGMLPHGHYCVPIRFKNELLGVLCLYVQEGHSRRVEENLFLASVAEAIAAAIQHVRTAEALRKSEERFDLAVRGTDAGIWDWDMQSGTVYFSARWKSMLGYDESEIGNQFFEWDSRLHPEDRERALNTVQDYLENRVPEYEMEHRLRHKDGSYRWILARGIALRDGSGRAYRMAGSHIDITARKLAEERLRHNEAQLLAAQKIQEALLPTVPPSVDWLDIAGVSHPATFAGGDYFDYLPMSGGSTGVVIGDVSGHGFAPALLMASTQAFLQCLVQTCATLGETLFRLNNFVAHETETERFITQLVIRFDAKTRSLTYINAGHPEGLVLDRRGHPKSRLKSGGMPLGLIEDLEYTVLEQLPLEAGDIVLLLTDGILEAASAQGEVFGWQRVLAVMQQSCEKSASEICEDLIDIVSEFCSGAEVADDRTALVVKVVR